MGIQLMALSSEIVSGNTGLGKPGLFPRRIKFFLVDKSDKEFLNPRGKWVKGSTGMKIATTAIRFALENLPGLLITSCASAACCVR